MSPRRREFARFLSVSTVAAATLACWAGIALAAGLWECNWCHQQYQGNQPPAFAKCPAKEMKQNHWWIRKG